jgi:hypothetical protein
LVAASTMMAQPNINVTISQISGWTISNKKRRMNAPQWGRRQQQTRGGAGPGTNASVANDVNNTNNHDNAASSYRGGVGGRYKEDANYYNGNKDRGECKIWLSRSLKEMDLWKVRYMD